MSLDYSLKLSNASLEPNVRDAVMSSLPDLKPSFDIPDSVVFAAVNPDLYITAIESKDQFHNLGGCSFRTTSTINYRIRDKFEYPRCICAMVRSVNAVLHSVQGDLVLLFTGDTPLLVRCEGQLKISRRIGKSPSFWDVDGRKQLLTHEYEEVPLKL